MKISRSVDRKDMRDIFANRPKGEMGMTRFSELLLKHSNSFGLHTVSSAILEKRRRDLQEINLVNQMKSLGLIKDTQRTGDTESRGNTSNRITTRGKEDLGKGLGQVREKSKNVKFFFLEKVQNLTLEISPNEKCLYRNIHIYRSFNYIWRILRRI